MSILESNQEALPGHPDGGDLGGCRFDHGFVPIAVTADAFITVLLSDAQLVRQVRATDPLELALSRVSLPQEVERIGRLRAS